MAQKSTSLPSYITWFDEDNYIGQELAFSSGSIWKLQTKIQESEDLKIAGNGPSTAVIKIHMQIPYWESATKKPSVRATQAVPELPFRGKRGVEALSILTRPGCSSAPSLIDWMYRRQSNDEWVPGINVSLIFDSLDRRERDNLRRAFKKAWLECISCGVEHGDSGSRNILWDREGQKCYLIDFEHFDRPTSKTMIWRDVNYIVWNMAKAGSSADYEDMSTWNL
ncbi:hypothetical protein ASPCADRAFT_514520 [Aspergillus carbonarius ITEM 5010]|uniref:Aminoglycoside phosphotransferase domain-containing protein n=1 Tax=Aspergillus carbonarius (strain ITEM 5010) TaxID=602072 RepID=A0A1R3RSX7_ASPC5|nr:hypothetical protein ASPCADRAFT_514520 [Aspergillus carbonarius ITEM 5010]